MNDKNKIFTKNCPTPERIALDIKSQGYFIYKNVIQREVIEDLRNFWLLYFGKISNNKVVRGNLILGEKNFNSYVDSSEWCLYRDFDFLWNKPTHKTTRRLNLEIHQLRNLAQGLPSDFGLTYSEDNYGFYGSTSNYPPCNGFLKNHSDGHNKEDIPILQFMVPITYKGYDYKGGGLVIINKEGEKVDVDVQMTVGSLVFFDGRLQHGVEKIIPSEGKEIGRIATFAVPTFFLTDKDIPFLFRWILSGYLRLKRECILKTND
jgi:hypothetical protein